MSSIKTFGRVIPALFLLLNLISFGCGGAQKIGVRPKFENYAVSQIAIVQVYSTGTFSTETETFETLRQLYIQATENVVKNLGFDVITTETFEKSFATDEARQTFRDGIPTHRPLDKLFEPDSGIPGPEVEVVTAFAESLPSNTLLIAEIVYYTEGVCDTRPQRYTAYVEVDPPDAETPSDCVVSHFQAKLVDAKTGNTVWYNRLLLEHRGPITEESSRNVIFKNVKRVFESENGLANLRKTSS